MRFCNAHLVGVLGVGKLTVDGIDIGCAIGGGRFETNALFFDENFAVDMPPMMFIVVKLEGRCSIVMSFSKASILGRSDGQRVV